MIPAPTPLGLLATGKLISPKKATQSAEPCQVATVTDPPPKAIATTAESAVKLAAVLP